MALDPSIALQTQTPQIDLGAIYGAAMQLRQMHDQLQTQNALKAIAQQPGAIDEKTGSLTPNALAQIMKISPAEGMKAAAASGEAEQRAASAAHTASETQTVQTKQYRDEISGGLREYDAALASGNTAPDIAERQFRQGLVDQVGNLSLPQADRDRLTKLATETPLPQLRAYAMTQEAADAQKKLTDERTPAIINGQPGSTDKAGNTYDASGKPVVASSIERPSVAFNPDAAEEKARLAGNVQKPPQLLTDPKTGESYWEFAPHGDEKPRAVDMQGNPYTPQGAQRVASGAVRSATAEATKKFLEEHPNATSEDIIQFQAKGAGERAGETQLGRRGAQLSQAGNALDKLIDQSKAAYAKLPRGDFVPFNKLQKMVDEGTSSPAQAAAFTADQGAINQWAKAINPTGGLTVEATRKGADMLSNVTSLKAHDAVLEQMRQEIEAEKSSIPAARSDIRETGGDRGGGPARKPTAGEMASFAKVPPSRKEEARKAAQAAGIDISDLK